MLLLKYDSRFNFNDYQNDKDYNTLSSFLLSLRDRDNPNIMFLCINVWTQRHFTITWKHLILIKVNKYAFSVKLFSYAEGCCFTIKYFKIYYTLN